MNAPTAEQIADAISRRIPTVPPGRSWLNEAAEAKVADGTVTTRAPWSELSPEEQAAATAEQAAAQAAVIDAQVAAARATAVAAPTGHFGGGVQSAAPPAGESFGDAVRRRVFGGD